MKKRDQSEAKIACHQLEAHDFGHSMRLMLAFRKTEEDIPAMAVSDQLPESRSLRHRLVTERRGVLRWLPGVRLLWYYERSFWRQDLLAGLVMTAMLVPVGIAYAEASGVPGIFGLYATIVAMLAYMMFGPSRILVLGPDSALIAVVLSVVVPQAGGDPGRAIVLASAMAVVCGVACITAGLARLGFITELLSKPIRYGYINGIALAVLLSQTPKQLGFTVDGKNPLTQLLGIGEGLLQGRVHWPTFALGATVLAIIFFFRHFPRAPGMFIAIVLATLAVDMFDLANQSGVAVMGAMPYGLPAFSLPWLRSEDVLPVMLGGLAAALVSFADTSVLSRTYAMRLHQPVDPNQEMVALGMANLFAGFFQGFPISSSASRTPVAESAGARTQVSNGVAAIAIALLLVFAPALLSALPSVALSAVVIAASISLIEIRDLQRIYRIQRWEFWLSLACSAGVIVLGAIPGIALAIVAAVIEFLWDGWRPYSAVLGRVDGLKGYHDITRYPQARRIPGLVLLRWDAPLFFANAELFKERVLEAIDRAPTAVTWVMVAAEPVTSVDVTAADMLLELDSKLNECGIELCFAEMKDPVKDKLKRFGLLEVLGESSFYPTVGEAVNAYLRLHAVDWTDWEDQK